jgi:hypothetical protein
VLRAIILTSAIEAGSDLRPKGRRRMQPLLQQCYDSALGACSLASSIKSGEVGSLRIALSATIETALLMPNILKLRNHSSGLR